MVGSLLIQNGQGMFSKASRRERTLIEAVVVLFISKDVQNHIQDVASQCERRHLGVGAEIGWERYVVNAS